METIPLVIELREAAVGRDGRVIFDRLDFSIARGEVCYLIGKSGAGKSTLLKTLYGAIPLLDGYGRVGSHALDQLDRKSIPLMRREIGMVFQEFHLFDRWTVRTNLDYILKATEWKSENERKERIEKVISQVNLTDKLEEPIHRLSGGEQQRVVIARSVLNRPEIIIADEPTGNLDPESSELIMEMLYDVASENGTAILLATHDYHLIERFPGRVFECKDGSINEKR